MQLNELKEIVAAAGVVGAGGAGFPTAVKLAEGVDTLIINAAECEPLLYTDNMLQKIQLPRIVAGAEQILVAAGIPKGILAIKSHHLPDLGLTHGERLSPRLTVYGLPDAYPMGDEVILTYEVLGRVIRPGALPLSVGALICNAETVYNVARAVEENRPVTEKWLTIGGKVPQPTVVCAPVGMRVQEVLDTLDIPVPEDHVVVDGGPAMGTVIRPEEAVIRKTTNGLVILPRTIPAIASKLNENRVVNIHATSNCCQCTRCTDLCPRALIGYPLEPHKIVRASMNMVEAMPEQYTGASVCSGCGVCELVACCQNISPRRVYAQVKGILAKNKLKYTGGAGPVDPDRSYRMVPHDRFQRLIGVAPYDRMPILRETPLTASEIRLPTRQHVGAPAVACVQRGEVVEAGQIVARANGAVSASVHSPIRGVVTAVSGSTVVIVPQKDHTREVDVV